LFIAGFALTRFLKASAGDEEGQESQGRDRGSEEEGDEEEESVPPARRSR